MNKLNLSSLFKTSDKLSLAVILIFIATALLLSLFLVLFLDILPPKLPLFYSLAWGETQLVQKSQFFILPAVILLIGLINLSLASQLHPAQTALKRMLILSVLVISIIIFITAFKILAIFI